MKQRLASSAASTALRKVTAIIRADRLAAAEAAVLALNVPGISVTRVKGFGEYRNFYATDLLDEHVRVEIFLERDEAHRVAQAIADAARTGIEGDGIVVVLPVEAMYHIRSRQQTLSDEFGAPGSRAASRSSGTLKEG